MTHIMVNHTPNDWMGKELFVVVVDSRGRTPSDIDAYSEKRCPPSIFAKRIANNPKFTCTTSTVAKMCGLDMKIYFQNHVLGKVRNLSELSPEMGVSDAIQDMYPIKKTNGAATLLTIDPQTGYPEYKILGKAYIVVNDGSYPLSNHQVWGIEELISEAKDIYHCDPDHARRGKKNLVHWCLQYQEGNWGPPTVYQQRACYVAANDDNHINVNNDDDYYDYDADDDDTSIRAVCHQKKSQNLNGYSCSVSSNKTCYHGRLGRVKQHEDHSDRENQRHGHNNNNNNSHRSHRREAEKRHKKDPRRSSSRHGDKQYQKTKSEQHVRFVD